MSEKPTLGPREALLLGPCRQLPVESAITNCSGNAFPGDQEQSTGKSIELESLKEHRGGCEKT